jgi:hypothetical protein
LSDSDRDQLPKTDRADPDEPRTLKVPAGNVSCRPRLGGLLKHYSRAA